jgi:predicted amidohydrolase YtcJ
MVFRILLTLLFFSGISVIAQESLAPDAIFYNGKIVTVDSDFHIQQAFAIQSEKFIAVGTDAKIRQLAGKTTRLVDLKGATVIPGLADNHDHLFNAARFMYRGVDLIGVSSLTEIQNRLRKAVAAAKPGQVIFSTLGWTVRPFPTRKDLDQVSAEVPIVLIAARRGEACYNSAALKLAGISKENPSFGGMHVPTDASGELTGSGPHYPQSLALIAKLIPKLSPAEEEDVVIRGFKERNALGITSIRDLAVFPGTFQVYHRVWRQERLTGRISVGIEFPDAENTARNLANMGVSVGFGDHWLRIDSSSEEPWPPGSITPERYTELMLQMNALGWRPAPHVSSDSSRGKDDYDAPVNNTLDAFEAADRAASIKDKRWIVEHVHFSTPEQIDRMAKLGVIVSAQYYGFYGSMANFPKEQERLDHITPMRRFLDRGVVVIGGSDYLGPTPANMEPNNPFKNFYFYVTRKTIDGKPYGPAEKISRQEALRVLTVNSAYATFEEKVKGSIEPGKLADFVILSQDLMTVPDERLLETKALATFVSGKKVYSAAGNTF